MYIDIRNKIENIKTTLTNYEEKIFTGHEKEMVYELSKINRMVIYFKETLTAHQEFFDTLPNLTTTILSNEFKKGIQSTGAEYQKSKNALDSIKLYIQELRETNNSLLSTKQNEIMKLLAIMSFVVFPLALISNVFGMNTVNLPIVGHEYDFEIISGAMLILVILLFVFFKKKKWL